MKFKLHTPNGTARLPVRIAAWIVILIYLVGPFHLQFCTGAYIQGEECGEPVDPTPSCCSQEAEHSAPVDCGENGDCCIELASEPPIGILQNINHTPLTTPSISNLHTEALPQPAKLTALTSAEDSPPTGPPLYILHDVLRR